MNFKEHNKKALKSLIGTFLASGDEATAFTEAARWGENEILKELLHRVPVDAVGKSGCTALMLASLAGNVNAVKLLLDNKANCNLRGTINGDTALMCCLSAIHTEATYLKVAKLLLEAGADPTIVDVEGRSTRSWGEGCKSKKVLDLLDHYIKKFED